MRTKNQVSCDLWSYIAPLCNSRILSMYDTEKTNNKRLDWDSNNTAAGYSRRTFAYTQLSCRIRAFNILQKVSEIWSLQV